MTMWSAAARMRSNPDEKGTKAAFHYVLDIPAGGEAVIRLRLSAEQSAQPEPLTDAFDRTFAIRIREADEYYADRIPAALDVEERNVMRQAYAGLLWSKQFFHFSVKDWLEGDPAQPAPPEGRRFGRNNDWTHRLQPRRDLDAGQMGISVVRRVGPGVPHDSSVAP